MIPIAKPSIGDKEMSLVREAVESGWVSSQGAFLEKFEAAFAAFCGTKYCVLTFNGSVAIQLLLEALKVGHNDEVIVPDLTFVATANMVKVTGAQPVLVDVTEDGWCIDPDKVVEKITSKTKAIIAVHLYGNVADMDKLRDIATKHKLYLIEDAAEAHGASLNGKKVGGLGDAGTFSFYGNKIITTGEGGAITTNSEEIALRAKFLRDHGMSKEKRYWHPELGFNYRMTNIQAALGLAQLSQIEIFLADRDRIFKSYKKKLEPHGLILNPQIDGIKPVNWMTSVVAGQLTRDSRDKLLESMKACDIEVRPFFYPLSHFPMYLSETNPVTEKLSATGFNLPTFFGMEEEAITQTSTILLEQLKNIK